MSGSDSPYVLETLTLVQNTACYRAIRIYGPTGLQIDWDAVCNFNDTAVFYSSCGESPAVPPLGDAITAYLGDWSLESVAVVQADASALGSKVYHLGNWRARWLLFAVTPTSNGGDVGFTRGEVGNNARR